MSHHFDTRAAKEDPRLNLCDFYLFAGAAGKTAMAMTVNPDVVLSIPDLLHPEGIYAFRFDLDGDAREDIVFKFRFSEPEGAVTDGAIHTQRFEVRRAAGSAIHGDEGDLLIEGTTGSEARQGDVSAYAGTRPDLFAGNGAGLHTFLKAFHSDHQYNGEAFQNGVNVLAKRNVTAMVLEVPNGLIGQGKVHAWATTSLYGHAPEVQVQRWGLPLLTHLFLSSSDELKEKYNASVPSDDALWLAKPLADFVERMTSYAGSAESPSDYANQIVRRLCPAMLPYEIGTQAAFDVGGFNGRPLADDAMDVMLMLASNRPLADGVAPDRDRVRTEFPYFGEPYAKAEQADVTPISRPAHK